MKNKKVIITGADGNLGKEAVNEFSKAGAKVAAIYYGSKLGDIPANVCAVEHCDLTDEKQAKSAVNKASENMDQPDILINIAGGFTWREIKDTTPQDFDAQFNLNFKTMYNMTMAALDGISKSSNGRIINIGAMGAITAGAGMAAYAVSKSAVMRFTEALAAETADNVTINAILPSIIDTPENRRDLPDADRSKWVKTNEIVDVLMFLSSNKASGINGALLPVTGRL